MESSNYENAASALRMAEYRKKGTFGEEVQLALAYAVMALVDQLRGEAEE